MDSPVSKQLDVIIPAFRMHTQSFMNVLDGISEEDARKRIEGRTNHLVWMTGNFVNMRYALAEALGLKGKDPYDALFTEGKALDESKTYPSLRELKDSFHEISPIAYKALLQVDDKQLALALPIGMNLPFVEENVLNFAGMCLGREDYLCGQMGLMRRILNYPGMKYEMNTDLKY